MSDFSNYSLSTIHQATSGVYGLADDLLPEIAAAFGYRLGATPYEKDIFGLVHDIAPHPELQKNIAFFKERLGDDAVNIAAEWVERSGVLVPVSGAFVDPVGTPIPERVDAIVWSGGVANWIMRRLMLTLRQDPTSVGRVILAMGNRLMSAGEHQLVASYMRDHDGRRPTEYEFAELYVMPVLLIAGFKCTLMRVHHANGDKVYDTLFQANPELLAGTILTVGNAPNIIQAAGQLRAAAQRASGGRFDHKNGVQLFMVCDTIPLALKGEGTATHQNPISAVGQVLRSAGFVHKAVMVL